jgi:predicted hotdog family 3-hydroxylacyl-ACP dehydratase
MAIEGALLESSIPHKGRMALLSRVLQYDFEEESLVSEVDIRETDLFFDAERGGVPSWIGFEYMAQSIAALSGIRRRMELGEEPRIGFIMSVRDFTARVGMFAPGQTLRVEVRKIFRDGDVASFACSIGESAAEQVHAIINAIEADGGPHAAVGEKDG